MLSLPEIKILVLWFRRNGDFPAPQTRQALLLTRLGETSHQGDQHQVPAEEVTTAVVLAASPIPPTILPPWPTVDNCADTQG